MKKVVLAVVVLFLAVPAMAVVTIDAVHEGAGVVRIDYTSNEPNKITGFALVIEVTGASITDVNEYKKGESTASKRGYGIFLDPFVGIEIDVNGLLTGRMWGSCVSDSNQPGAAGTGIGTNKVIAEMGALYYPTGDTSPNAPGDSGTLGWVTVDASCTMSITPEDASRIGVTLSNGNSSADLSSPVEVNAPGYDGRIPIAISLACFPGSPGDPNYDNWVKAGEPDCWCPSPFGSGWSCRGDSDNAFTGTDETGKRKWVSLDDLNLLGACYLKKESKFPDPNCICADTNYNFTGTDELGKRKWVSLDDLNTLGAYYLKKESKIPEGDCFD